MHVGIRQLAIGCASVSMALGLVTAPWLSMGASASQVTQIPVGSFPKGIAIDPVTRQVYVASEIGQSLTVISPAGSVINTIPLGFDAWSVAVDHATLRAYVGGVADGTVVATVDVSSIDAPRSNRIVAVTPVGNGGYSQLSTYPINPVALALDPATHTLYVAMPGTNALTTLGTLGGQPAGQPGENWPTGNYPDAIAVDSAAKRVYVANVQSNNVTVIDPSDRHVIATIPVGRAPSGIAVNPTTHHVFVTNLLDNTLSIIDGASNTGISTLPVLAQPYGVATDPTYNLAVVASNDAFGTTVIMDYKTGGAPDTVYNTAAGAGGFAVAIDPAGRTYLAAKSSINVIPWDLYP